MMMKSDISPNRLWTLFSKLKPKSEFSRNVLTLMTGTTIAQAIPIAISPILTRIYTPENFGVFAIFIAISSIFGSIANARYEQAIMLPKKDEDAINIFALSFIITIILSLLLLICVVVINNFYTELIDNKEILFWLYFIPLSVLLTGVYNILNYFNNRKQNYSDIANATITKSIVSATIQLLFGLLKSGVMGLIGGQLISNFFANLKLIKNITNEKELLFSIKKLKLIAVAKKYRNFPKYSLLAVLANTFSVHFTNILISSFYSISTLGFYSLVQRVLGMPTALIGGAIGQVFFQEATKEKQRTGKITHTFTSTFIKLLVLGFPTFGILFFIIEDLFALVFGEEWRIAGVYAKVVIPLFFIKFISSTLSKTLIIFEKQKSELLINLLLISTSILLLLFFNNFNQFLHYFTICMSLNYFLFLLYYHKLSKGN